jgi:polyphosphate glucokinase
LANGVNAGAVDVLGRLFHPDLIILGSGVSKNSQLFLRHLRCSAPVAVARLLNDAGMVGAALVAAREG